MAPRSSIMASATKKTFKETGTLEPRSDRTPIEKAMSVAVGIAQPLKVWPVSKFIITWSARDRKNNNNYKFDK